MGLIYSLVDSDFFFVGVSLAGWSFGVIAHHPLWCPITAWAHRHAPLRGRIRNDEENA
jgi:hypothetical protein